MQYYLAVYMILAVSCSLALGAEESEESEATALERGESTVDELLDEVVSRVEAIEKTLARPTCLTGTFIVHRNYGEYPKKMLSFNSRSGYPDFFSKKPTVTASLAGFYGGLYAGEGKDGVGSVNKVNIHVGTVTSSSALISFDSLHGSNVYQIKTAWIACA